MALVVGVDAAKASSWIAVALRDGRLHEMSTHQTLADLVQTFPSATVFAIDIPVGHEDPEGRRDEGRRACDASARSYLAPERRASVFHVPPPAVFREETHEAAVAACRARGWSAPSAQLWALRPRIVEADAFAADPRVFEVHPEASFQALAESLAKPAPTQSKATWSGLVERLELLHGARLRPERSVGGVGRASPDDVLDATIAAWTAQRIDEGAARRFPHDPPRDPRTGRAVAITA